MANRLSNASWLAPHIDDPPFLDGSRAERQKGAPRTDTAGVRPCVGQGIAREIALPRQEGLAFRISDVSEYRPAAIREVEARGDAAAVVRTVAPIRLPPLRVELDAVELLLEPEVHDTRHRVGAVYRGGAAGDDLDAFDQGARDDVQVDDARAVRRDQPLAIDQHQGRGAAETPQLDVGLAAIRRIVGRAGVPRHELRQRVDRRLDRARASALEELLRHRDDRARGVEVRTRDAGAGDEDLLELGLLAQGRGGAGADPDEQYAAETRSRARVRSACSAATPTSGSTRMHAHVINDVAHPNPQSILVRGSFAGDRVRSIRGVRKPILPPLPQVKKLWLAAGLTWVILRDDARIQPSPREQNSQPGAHQS